MNEAQLIKAIKAHIAKGEQHYISAGLHLAKLKERCPDQETFLALVKDKIGIGKSRTYELLQIADGRKTVEEVRADTAERQEKHRLSVTNGQRKPGNGTASPAEAVVKLKEALNAVVKRDLALGLYEEPEQESAKLPRKRWADMTSVEQMHRMVPRITKALAKSDPECAGWLHTILLVKDPTVLQELEVALARQLGIDEEESPAAPPPDDGLDIPESLRRTA